VRTMAGSGARGAEATGSSSRATYKQIGICLLLHRGSHILVFSCRTLLGNYTFLNPNLSCSKQNKTGNQNHVLLTKKNFVMESKPWSYKLSVQATNVTLFL
jgi:hypothetical protein